MSAKQLRRVETLMLKAIVQVSAGSNEHRVVVSGLGLDLFPSSNSGLDEIGEWLGQRGSSVEAFQMPALPRREI
ncbi:MAG TPA: hypothetical protein VKQ29_13685 [Aliidongia sp.]|nr:hypothetical protein [Aliidongia sp.]